MNTIQIDYFTLNITPADASVANAAMASSGMILNDHPEITPNTPPQGLTANPFLEAPIFLVQKRGSEASQTISSLLIYIICYSKIDAQHKPKIQHVYKIIRFTL